MYGRLKYNDDYTAKIGGIVECNPPFGAIYILQKRYLKSKKVLIVTQNITYALHIS